MSERTVKSIRSPGAVCAVRRSGAAAARGGAGAGLWVRGAGVGDCGDAGAGGRRLRADCRPRFCRAQQSAAAGAVRRRGCANGLPKAIAAAEKLQRINSERRDRAGGRRRDVSRTSRELAGDVDVIVDGTDNFATRFLVNDFAVKHGKPWVYGGCIGAEGQTMTICRARRRAWRASCRSRRRRVRRRPATRRASWGRWSA